MSNENTSENTSNTNGSAKRRVTKKEFMVAWKAYSDASAAVKAAQEAEAAAAKAIYEMVGSKTFNVAGEAYKASKVPGRKAEGAPERYRVSPQSAPELNF